VALKASLDFIAGLGGVAKLVENAGLLAGMTRAAAHALRLPLVAPKAYGDALTALYPPQGIESGAIVKGLKADYMSTVAGGQGALKGKIFRIAHLGYYDVNRHPGPDRHLEVVLKRLGYSFELGQGWRPRR